MSTHPELGHWFFGTWIILMFVGFCLFYLSKNVARKKRLLPIFIIGTGILFVCFAFLITGPSNITFLMIPVAALIVFLNLRMIKVCEACGLVYTRDMFSKMAYCPKCGAKLQ